MPVVYLGGTLALAALELLVHIDHRSALRKHFAIPVEFAEELVVAVDSADLPGGFPDPRTLEATRRIGDSWSSSEVSPLLRVPSAVVPQEYNYLFNPFHTQAQRVHIGEPVPFDFDRRLTE